MNFTLKEYFYKLYNRSMMMLLLPIAEFLAIYYLILSGVLPPIIEDSLGVEILLISIPIIVLVILTIVQLGTLKRCKKITSEVSLGKKLDLYSPVIKRKINSIVWVSFLLAIGFFLTSDQRFSIYFGAIILWCAWQWPSPRRVSRDLKLKGDEREMVITKGEAFKV
ncbi:MAG: hypothetical protein HY015_06260 [Bacteroidetes bacterium]|nr:hypothetical protein [Bacteroidota bacterium]MBI3482566.1 hypothetical protein [Bacteroidota bacterium]